MKQTPFGLIGRLMSAPSTVEIDRWLHTGAEDLAESEPQPHFQHMFFGPRRSEVANHNVPDHTHPTPSSEFSLLYFD